MYLPAQGKAVVERAKSDTHMAHQYHTRWSYLQEIVCGYHVENEGKAFRCSQPGESAPLVAGDGRTFIAATRQALTVRKTRHSRIHFLLMCIKRGRIAV